MKKKYSLKKLFSVLSIFTLLGLPALGHSEETKAAPKNFLEWPTLTGTWGGARQSLVDHGVNFEFTLTGDFYGNVSGGLEKGQKYLQNAYMGLTVDTDKLMHWKGGTIKVSSNITWGGSPSELAGDMQTLSNIDAPDMALLFEAYLQQNFMDDKVSLLAGIFNLNMDFDSIPSAALFLNSSHGMGVDLTQSGENGLSIYPYTAFGGRVRFKPAPGLYLQMAATDAVPGDPGGNEHSTQIKLKKSEGTFFINEVGYNNLDRNKEGRNVKLGIGSWFYSNADFEDLTEVDAAGDPIHHGGNWGIYALADIQVTREEEHPEQGLSIYFRIGRAAPSLNPIEIYAGAGMVYTGPFGRDNDKFGIGLATASYGAPAKAAAEAAGLALNTSEFNIEMTYKYQATPWLSIQPDIQYIVHPSGDPTLNNALVLGTRFNISF